VTHMQHMVFEDNEDAQCFRVMQNPTCTTLHHAFAMQSDMKALSSVTLMLLLWPPGIGIGHNDDDDDDEDSVCAF